MEQRMRIALSEVNCILENSEEEVTSKIPQKFKDYLRVNMDKEYKPSLVPGLAIFAQPISIEARELLKLVYRDFLATEDERKILIQKDKKILEESNTSNKSINSNKKQEDKKLEANKIDIFEKKKKGNEPIKNLQLTEIKEKWYKKLFRRLKNLVNGRKI